MESLNRFATAQTNDHLLAEGNMDQDETDQHDVFASGPQHEADHHHTMEHEGDPTESGILGMAETESPEMNATMTASHSSLLHLSNSEPSLKRLDQDSFLSQSSLSRMDSTPFVRAEQEDLHPPAAPVNRPPAVPKEEENVTEAKDGVVSASPAEDTAGMVSPDEGTASSSHADSSNQSLSDVPLKATTFKHLNQKYLGELEYMLKEFQKLERQLLGAKTMQSVESAGSRERREKLHSFILHLDDTITQIRTGCDLEAAGQSTVAGPLESTSLAKLTQEKEEEENVQKLEEHILANLLPVKVRLKKQLAAQQGAKHNPAGMPVRGVVADASKTNGNATGAGTFMAAAKQRTQFGKPLAGEGSSLTQKLHGQTLGSEKRIHGHGVGRSSTKEAEVPAEENKILYAGMALGSNQMKSSLTAASGAHRVVVHDPELLVMSSRKRSRERISQETEASSSMDTERQPSLRTEESMAPPAKQRQKRSDPAPATPAVVPAKTHPVATVKLNPPATTLKTGSATIVQPTPNLTAEERRRLRKKRRKKKRLQREQEKQSKLQQQSSGGSKRKKSANGACKKRGPRGVEYMCALCNEVYNYTCDYNPWWALSQHECPKCRKIQVPRVDISAPANAIEYHPALLAHADDNSGGSNAVLAMRAAAAKAPPPSPKEETEGSDSDDSDLSDDDESSDDSFSDESDPEALASMSPAEQAEIEKFGADYKGPKLTPKDSARLLPLMLHASTCPCRHRSSQHGDVCRSMKWMMLHVRDCPGTTATFDVCPFPWCRKIKHFMYHLVSCKEQEACQICGPDAVGGNFAALRGLSDFRLQRRKEMLVKKAIAQTKTKSTIGRSATSISSPKPQSSHLIKTQPQAQPRATSTTTATATCVSSIPAEVRSSAAGGVKTGTYTPYAPATAASVSRHPGDPKLKLVTALHPRDKDRKPSENCIMRLANAPGASSNPAPKSMLAAAQHKVQVAPPAATAAPTCASISASSSAAPGAPAPAPGTTSNAAVASPSASVTSPAARPPALQSHVSSVSSAVNLGLAEAAGKGAGDAALPHPLPSPAQVKEEIPKTDSSALTAVAGPTVKFELGTANESAVVCESIAPASRVPMPGTNVKVTPASATQVSVAATAVVEATPSSATLALGTAAESSMPTTQVANAVPASSAQASTAATETPMPTTRAVKAETGSTATSVGTPMKSFVAVKSEPGEAAERTTAGNADIPIAVGRVPNATAAATVAAGTEPRMDSTTPATRMPVASTAKAVEPIPGTESRMGNTAQTSARAEETATSAAKPTAHKGASTVPRATPSSSTEASSQRGSDKPGEAEPVSVR